MRTLLSVLLLIPLALAVPAHADDACSRLATSGPVAVGGYYVDVRSSLDVWVYRESNGLSGLQRGGTNALDQRDPCVDDRLVTPDHLVF